MFYFKICFLTDGNNSELVTSHRLLSNILYTDSLFDVFKLLPHVTVKGLLYVMEY